MSDLVDKQQRFAFMVADLLNWCRRKGYGITLAEAYRPPDVAALYARQGRGIKASLHCKRLAIDLNLFIDGIYQTTTDAYLSLGEYWENLGGAWGGRFKNRDAVHFSLPHNGVR